MSRPSNTLYYDDGIQIAGLLHRRRVLGLGERKENSSSDAPRRIGTDYFNAPKSSTLRPSGFRNERLAKPFPRHSDFNFTTSRRLDLQSQGIHMAGVQPYLVHLHRNAADDFRIIGKEPSSGVDLNLPNQGVADTVYAETEWVDLKAHCPSGLCAAHTAGPIVAPRKYPY